MLCFVLNYFRIKGKKVLIMSAKSNRQEVIISKLGNKQGMTIHELAVACRVSEMTIRRDLRDLSDKGYLEIIKGVAFLKRNSDGTSIVKSYSLPIERNVMSEAKRRIGLKAASLIEPSDTIIIDTGTTTECILNYLPNDSNLTFICHNTNILTGLIAKGFTQLIFPGGFYHNNTEFFESPESVSLISRSCASKYFCSAAGIGPSGQVTCIEQYEINTKQACLKSALKSYLMCDSSKFGKIRPALFATINDFDAVITDSGISNIWIDFFDKHDIEYYIV